MTQNSIRATAEKVAANHADLELAGAELRDARAALLRERLEEVRPAARALASPVGIALAGSPGENTVIRPAGWRGLYLAGSGPQAVGRAAVQTPGAPRGTVHERGRYAGTRLLLRDDGRLVELSYDGPWSSVPGEVSSWTAAAREVEPEEVAGRYKLEEILESLGIALHEQAKSRRAATAADLRAKAARLRALAQLVRGL